MGYIIPPDTRAVGTVDPPGDMNNVADMLGLIAALFAQLAGAGTNADPAGNATNVTAMTALRTAAALAPGGSGTVLTSNGTGSEPTFQQSFVIPTGVKTANYTASAGDLVACDTSSGSFTVTLPSAPAGLTPVTVVLVNGTNPLTIATGGTDVYDRAGGATSKTLVYAGQSSELQYRSSGGIWYRKGGHLPLTSLDTRYILAGAQNFTGIFGDGSDGAVTCDGTTDLTAKGFGAPAGSVYTMTRDVLCTSLTINNGVTVQPNGWRIFCTGTFTNNGTVSAAGVAGFAGGAAGGGGGGNGTLQGGKTGGAGQTGAGTAGNNANGAGITAGGTGGTGTGGAGGSGGTAGSSGTAWFRNPGAALAGAMSVAGTLAAVTGGPGGGGGGGDTTNKGGGGGGGGGAVVIFAQSANNGSGTINVSGGAGATPTAGNTGGGGGGSGGVILVYTLTAWTAGTTNVSGGAAGSPHGTGTNNASAGASGSVVNQVLT